MSDHSCPHHDFIPCFARYGDQLLWQQQTIATPRYPFFCTIAEKVEWFTADEAIDRGLAHVAYTHTDARTPGA